jgi:hypothetical protein
VTGAEVISRARVNSRVDVLGVTDAQALDMVNAAIIDFADEVSGIEKDEALQIEALFWVETTMAINIAITGEHTTNEQAAADVAVTAADADAQTGTEMAALLQTAIRTLDGISTATVVWSDFAFTIDSIDGTDVTLAAVSDTTTYEDATAMLFGGGQVSGAQTLVGAFPRNCTKRVQLPTDFRDVKYLEWDEREMFKRSFAYIADAEGTGQPFYYALGADDDYLWLDRSPDIRKLLLLTYMATPVALASDGETPDIEADYHTILSWRVTELLARQIQDFEVSDRAHVEFQKGCNHYRARYANRATGMRTARDRQDRQSGRLIITGSV